MKEEKKDPFDGEYIGNLWGWNFSLVGLVVIVLLTGIMAYRHYYLGQPILDEKSPTVVQDTISATPKE